MIHVCYAPVASPLPVRPVGYSHTAASARLALPYRNQIIYVPVADIVWLEGSSNYTYIHTRDNRRYLIAKNLKRLEVEISSASFCRIHKSAVANLTYLSDVCFGDEPHMQLKNGQTLSISRRRLPATRRQVRSHQRAMMN